MKNNTVIYTAIFGNRDILKPVKRQPGFDYILFTDNLEFKSEDYQVITCGQPYDDSKRESQFYKILQPEAIKDYEYSLWVDASTKIEVPDFNILFERYLSDHDFALHSHPERTCIYEEAKKCIEIKKDKEEIITEQMNKYRQEGFPENFGLNNCGILFRHHTLEVKKFCELWWNEIENHSKRDQLSFNYVVWKTGLKFFTIPGHVRNREVDGFTLFPHYRNYKADSQFPISD